MSSNAFALGARMINPYVKIHLEWSKAKGQNARERLMQEGITIAASTSTSVSAFSIAIVFIFPSNACSR